MVWIRRCALPSALVLLALGVRSRAQERPGYLVAQISIEDRELYGRYEAGFLPIFAKHGGEILAVSESPVTLEGEWPYTRTVVLRFPSLEALRGWYDSAEYQALAENRWRSSEANVVALEGR